MMNDRLRKALVALMAVAALGACGDKAPVDVGDDEAERLQTNPSSVAVNAGDTTYVDAFLVTALNHPLQGTATYESCDPTIATVVAADLTEAEPGTRFGVVGQSIGTTCVTVRSGEFEVTIPVRVIAADFLVTDVPDSIRAGASGDLTVQVVNAQGVPIGPFEESNATFSSSNTDRLFFTDSVGGFDTEEAGPVNATIRWTHLGVTRTRVVPLLVIPAEPDAASLSPANFGAVAGGDSAMVTVIVVDSLDNVNRLPGDMLSITATSADESVATVEASFVEDPAAPGEVDAVVWATGQAGGSTTVDIVLTTVTETFTFEDVPITVVAPSVLTITPSSGQPGELITVTGTGLTSAGLTTGVTVGAMDATVNVVSATPTAVTFIAPMTPVNGDSDVRVTVGGVPSENSVTYTQETRTDVYSPENEDASTAPLIPAPGEIVGTTSGENIDDYYRFVVPEAGSYDIRLTIQGTKDLDMFLTTPSGAGVGCGGAATGANPENINNCSLAAGTYMIHVNDWDADHGSGGPVGYHLQISRD